MSICRNYYVISGYDITGYKTDKYDDWVWSDVAENYICNQTKGEIQLFDDPVRGEHLYFGYVLADGDQYSFETESFTTRDIELKMLDVTLKLYELVELGVISKDIYNNIDYKIIVFEECT